MGFWMKRASCEVLMSVRICGAVEQTRLTRLAMFVSIGNFPIIGSVSDRFETFEIRRKNVRFSTKFRTCITAVKVILVLLRVYSDADLPLSFRFGDSPV